MNSELRAQAKALRDGMYMQILRTGETKGISLPHFVQAIDAICNAIDPPATEVVELEFEDAERVAIGCLQQIVYPKDYAAKVVFMQGVNAVIAALKSEKSRQKVSE